MTLEPKASEELGTDAAGTASRRRLELDRSSLHELAREFQGRADSFRRNATAIIIPFVILALGASIWIFTSAVSVVGSELASLESEKTRAIVSQIDTLTELIAQTHREAQSATTVPVQEQLLAPISGYQETIAKLQESLTTDPIEIIPSFVQVNVTRFVTLAIIFFGITIFTGLYRKRAI